jgi:hypothetical protein
MFMQGIKVFLELMVGCAALIIGAEVFGKVILKATHRTCGAGSPDHSTAVHWWGWPAAWITAIVVGLAVAWAGVSILNL